ncbi:MAG TPA: Fe(2+)-trafficking protein [Tepidisphaeraceae bacterium]|jgi:Fe-S cluster biosynthesis and repair protein YggX|nr:Fe(2+)-trafficking protein [Tepidisphaeraceae bacterium]
MADIHSRIDQFKKMASDDPNNELGHFSLGRAYLDAGIYDNAASSFDRVIEINPNMSRAYQLLASAQLRLGQKDKAIERLTQGVKIAHDRGDMMARNEMVKMLQDAGAPVPELKKTETDRPVGEGEVLCARCGKIGPRLPEPPFRNDLGREIEQKTCATCWREWIGMGTKVINEMRLPLSDPQAQKIFDQHMIEFLNLRPL